MKGVCVERISVPLSMRYDGNSYIETTAISVPYWRWNCTSEHLRHCWEHCTAPWQTFDREKECELLHTNTWNGQTTSFGEVQTVVNCYWFVHLCNRYQCLGLPTYITNGHQKSDSPGKGQSIVPRAYTDPRDQKATAIRFDYGVTYKVFLRERRSSCFRFIVSQLFFSFLILSPCARGDSVEPKYVGIAVVVVVVLTATKWLVRTENGPKGGKGFVTLFKHGPSVALIDKPYLHCASPKKSLLPRPEHEPQKTEYRDWN